MAEKASAWLLTLNDQCKVAIPRYQAYEYVVTSKKITVPLSPDYCDSILLWQAHSVPLFDLAMLLEQRTLDTENGVVIVAYQLASSTPLSFVGVVVRDTPVQIEVDDTQACELPEQYHGLLRASITTCFMHSDIPVPVIDIAYLCSKAFRATTL